MLVSHATVAQNRLSQFTAYNGFMLTALYIMQCGAYVPAFYSLTYNDLSDFVNAAFDAADRYL